MAKKHKKNKVAELPVKKPLAISSTLLELSKVPAKQQAFYPIQPPDLLPGVAPKEAMAMDYNDNINQLYQYANVLYSGQGFMGYQVLAELAQKSEYRSAAETIAKEMPQDTGALEAFPTMRNWQKHEFGDELLAVLR